MLILKVVIALSFFAATPAEPVRLNPESLSVLAPDPEDNKPAQIVVDAKGIVHTVFLGRLETGLSAVYYRACTLKGAVGEPVQLSTVPAGLPSIVQNGTRLVVCWPEIAEAGNQIRVAVSPDGGKTWPSTGVVAKTPILVTPRLFSDPQQGLYLYVRATVRELGERDAIYVFRSTDGGESWKGVSASGPLPGVPGEFRMERTRDRGLLVVWAQDDLGAWSIMAARSEDGGGTWGAPVRVNDEADALVGSPRLVTSEKGTLVVWRRYPGIVLADFSGDGRVWGKDRPIFADEANGALIYTLAGKDSVSVFAVRDQGKGVSRRFRLQGAALKWKDLSRGAAPAEIEVLYESPWRMSVCAALLRGKPAVAASVRTSPNAWSLAVFFPNRKGRADGILRLAPDLGGRERSLLFLLPLPDGVAVLYREQKARHMVMESYPGDLLFVRAQIPK